MVAFSIFLVDFDHFVELFIFLSSIVFDYYRKVIFISINWFWFKFPAPCNSQDKKQLAETKKPEPVQVQVFSKIHIYNSVPPGKVLNLENLTD